MDGLHALRALLGLWRAADQPGASPPPEARHDVASALVTALSEITALAREVYGEAAVSPWVIDREQALRRYCAPVGPDDPDRFDPDDRLACEWACSVVERFLAGHLTADGLAPELAEPARIVRGERILEALSGDLLVGRLPRAGVAQPPVDPTTAPPAPQPAPEPVQPRSCPPASVADRPGSRPTVRR
jgi:hypothetical protein